MSVGFRFFGSGALKKVGILNRPPETQQDTSRPEHGRLQFARFLFLRWADFLLLPSGNCSFLEQKMITTQKVRLEPKTIASSGAVKRLLSAPADFRTFPYLGLPLSHNSFSPTQTSLPTAPHPLGKRWLGRRLSIQLLVDHPTRQEHWNHK